MFETLKDLVCYLFFAIALCLIGAIYHAVTACKREK